MRILIVGAGSTGGYFGGRLAKAGRDVTFLVRPGRAEALGRDGLQIVSPYGDVSLKPQLATAADLKGPFDAVIVTVKAFSLAAAMDDMAAGVGPATVILPVLNGMKHLDGLADRFGAAAVAGGLCRIAATLDDRGRIVQMTRLQQIVYGELDGTVSPRLQALDQAMQGAGFDARLSTEIRREMWEKWIMLASLGAATCLMRGNIGEIEAAPGGVAFALALLDEIVAVANAVGTPPSEASVATAKGWLTQKGAPTDSSMYRDLQKGLPVEADQIVGDLVVRAKAAGLKTPLLSAAYANLMVYQNRLPRRA